jgi:D-3-phosphoglycerate dehydrogenase
MREESLRVMRILAVGDAFVLPKYFEQAFRIFQKRGASVETIYWGPTCRADLEHVIRAMEIQGPCYDSSIKALESHVAGCDMLLVDFCPVPKELIQGIGLIGVCRAGVNNVDLTAATDAGVPVVNVQGRNASAVAEFAIGLMLSESRHIARSHSSLMRGEWRKDYNAAPMELEDKTVGLVGYGSIGRRVARKLSGFGCRIVYFDPWVQDMAESHAKKVEFDQLLKESDIISIHARLTAETRGLIGKKEFAMMKKSVYLINTGRAELVDQQELYNVLRTQRIRGAALDVFSEEPLPSTHPFLSLDNVTLTPHMGGSTPESLQRSPKLLANNIGAAIKGEQETSIVNGEQLDYAIWSGRFNALKALTQCGKE